MSNNNIPAFRLVLCASLAVLFTFSASAAFSGAGSGTSGDPYQISNLQELNETRENLTAYYELVSDINASATSGWNGGSGWKPVGNDTSGFRFTGELDGNGYNISNLTIDRGPEYVGLFGGIGSSGVVANVSLLDADITSSDSAAGGFAGESFGSLSNVYVTGSVTGYTRAGGLAGYNRGSISDSFSRADVSGTYANPFVGGLASYNGDTISRSYSTGSVSGSDNDVGGLIGRNSGSATVSSSYWDVNTSGQSSSDGGIGLFTSEMKSQSELTGFDFTNTWEFVDGRNDNYPVLQLFNLQPQPPVASFTIEQKVGTGSDVFLARGPVQFIDDFSGGTSYNWSFDDGGFASVENPSHTFSSTGVYNVTLNASNSEGWDLAWREITVIDPYAGGSGTAGDPWEIRNVTQLQNMSKDLDGYFELVSDINASATSGWNGGSGWKPVGNDTSGFFFTGELDGNGYNISNLTIDRSFNTYVGLFGGIGSSGVVANVSLLDVDITNGNSVAGGFAGESYGSLSNVYVTGSVTGYTRAGGLVAFNRGSISDSFSRASVTDTYAAGDAGGLASYNSGTISRSYSTGSVSGDTSGGLIAFSSGSATVSSSYWDVNTSGQSSSDGGIGLFTSEMKSQSELTGFDFTNTWEFVGFVNDNYSVQQVFNLQGPGVRPVIVSTGPDGSNVDPSGGVSLSVEAEDVDSSMDIVFYNASDAVKIGEVLDVGNGTHSVTWTNLASDSSYSWYATVSDTGGTKTSSTASFTTFDVSLSWTDNSNNENGFNVYSNASGSFEKEGSVGEDVTSFDHSDSELDLGEYVCYRVKAFNQFGESSPATGCTTV